MIVHDLPPESHPPGWSYNPSAWPHRLPVLAAGLIGLGIATYLGLYQLDKVPTVWEPLFGEGSRRILKESVVAHLLPIPDALLGAFVYLLEIIADLVGGHTRWRTLPWAVLALGVVSYGLTAGSIVLIFLQAFAFHAFCTLCLASAACSIFIGLYVTPEVWATVQVSGFLGSFSRTFREQHARGQIKES